MAYSQALSTQTQLFYDDNGNLVQDGGFHYTYNGFNRLVEVREGGESGRLVAGYVYDHTGKRTMKTVYDEEGGNETFHYVSEDYMVVYNSTGAYPVKYVRDGSGTLMARINSDGSKDYYHPDHLGSTRIMTNESGDVIAEYEYLPYGGELAGGNNSVYTFTGQEHDPEINLMYYKARYHSPYLRQFTQPDSIIPDVYNPQALNRYAYTYNNPVKYEDPSGNIPILWGAFGIYIGLKIYAKFLEYSLDNPKDPSAIDCTKYVIGGTIKDTMLWVTGAASKGLGIGKQLYYAAATWVVSDAVESKMLEDDEFLAEYEDGMDMLAADIITDVGMKKIPKEVKQKIIKTEESRKIIKKAIDKNSKKSIKKARKIIKNEIEVYRENKKEDED